MLGEVGLPAPFAELVADEDGRLVIGRRAGDVRLGGRARAAASGRSPASARRARGPRLPVRADQTRVKAERKGKARARFDAFARRSRSIAAGGFDGDRHNRN